MKKLILMILLAGFSSFADASDISDSFIQKYNSLVPSESSSVRSDYLFEQIALGSKYTIMMLEQISSNNEDLGQKVDTLAEKLEILIEQNRKLLELLSGQNKKNSDQ